MINKRRDTVKKEERAELVVPETFTQEKDEKTDRSDAIHKQERESIRMLLNYGMELINGSEEQELLLIDYFISESEDLEFETPVYKNIFALFKEKLLDGIIIDANYLLDSSNAEYKSVAVDLMTDRYELSPKWKDKYKIIVPNEKDVLKNATYTNILRLKLRIVQKLTHENMEKLKVSKDENETNEILMTQRDLKKYEMSIAEILGIVVTMK